MEYQEVYHTHSRFPRHRTIRNKLYLKRSKNKLDQIILVPREGTARVQCYSPQKRYATLSHQLNSKIIWFAVRPTQLAWNVKCIKALVGVKKRWTHRVTKRESSGLVLS